LLPLAAWPPPLSHSRLPALSMAMPFQAPVTPSQRDTPGSCQPGMAALTAASSASSRVLATCNQRFSGTLFQDAALTTPAALRPGVQTSATTLPMAVPSPQPWAAVLAGCTTRLTGLESRVAIGSVAPGRRAPPGVGREAVAPG